MLNELAAQMTVTPINPLEFMPKDDKGERKNEKLYSTADYVQVVNLVLGYSFRVRETDETFEVLQPKGETWQDVTDAIETTLRADARDVGLSFVGKLRDAYIADAHKNHRYHPVKDFLNGLPAWNGDDHIGKLCGYLPEKDAKGLLSKFLKRWLIGAIARVYDPTVRNRVLILEGHQEMGKSYFCRWLCPLDKYYVEEAIHPENKDHKIRLWSTWMWEISELPSTTRAKDVEALKSFLTVVYPFDRKAYDRNPLKKPAMTSFVATANGVSGLLDDPSGNTRYMTVNLEKINFDYERDIDIRQLWAQAMALYAEDKTSYRLTKDEKALAEENNKNNEVAHPLDDYLQEYFFVDPTNKTLFAPSNSLLDELYVRGAVKAKDDFATKQIAESAFRLGLAKAQRGPKKTRGYVGIGLIPKK